MSIHLAPGRKVNLTGNQTSIPTKNLNVLEISVFGVILQREGVKSANPEFYPWNHIQKMEILPEPASLPVEDKKGKARATSGN